MEGGRRSAARPVSGYGTNRGADVMLRRAQAFHLLLPGGERVGRGGVTHMH